MDVLAESVGGPDTPYVVGDMEEGGGQDDRDFWIFVELWDCGIAIHS